MLSRLLQGHPTINTSIIHISRHPGIACVRADGRSLFGWRCSSSSVMRKGIVALAIPCRSVYKVPVGPVYRGVDTSLCTRHYLVQPTTTLIVILFTKSQFSVESQFTAPHTLQRSNLRASGGGREFGNSTKRSTEQRERKRGKNSTALRSISTEIGRV